MPRNAARPASVPIALRVVLAAFLAAFFAGFLAPFVAGFPNARFSQPTVAQASDMAAASGELIAGGGPDDFMAVRHMVFRGPWSEIGRSLAALAAEHGWKPRLVENPVPVRAQRAWFVSNYPAHVARMRGVAAFAGLRLDEDRAWLSTLSYGFARTGCSVVYFPPSLTESGQGMLSRNYDFTTGTFAGRQPTDAEIACTSRPYLLELHPTDGYASVEDAERLLRQIDLYYSSIPCHYMVADRFGRSLVWENDVSMEKGYAIWGETDETLVATSFMLHLHANGDSLLAEPHPAGSFNRYRRVREQIARTEGKLDDAEIRAVASCVAASHPAPPEPWAAGRTLWHALYNPSERSMSIDFYLGEEVDATTGAARIRRSGYREFALKAE